MRRDPGTSSSPSRGGAQRIWTFLDWRVDESNRMLSRVGVTSTIEAKPFDILVELLRHAGEVVTKEELLDAVWPSVTVIEGSLTTALSKLRKAIGDDAGEIIVTVPRIGYRFAAPVIVTSSDRAMRELAIDVGSAVPDRPHWRYVERLSHSPHAEVWRITHDKTRVSHVLKLTADAGGLRALKREVAVARLFRETLGERPDFVPVLDWNFARAPFFIESVDGGANLNQWAETQGGLSMVPLAVRLELMTAIATTVAAANGIGVLQKDLKPGNILISADRDGHWQTKVVDFGSAALMEPDRLAHLGITHTAAGEDDDGIAGTTPWLAPELFAGRTPSLASDVYALGVLLYQIVAGDLRRPLATGWEQHVTDSLLREDIAAATAGDPEHRLDSAAELARRLRDLERRRTDAADFALTADRARLAEEKLARLRARRPWVIAAGVALLLGAGISTVMTIRAAQERDNALRQTRIADSVNRFLANDLLSRSSPFRSASANETFVDAVRQAAPLIDRRFPDEPATAARLHQTIANAFDKRSSWADARLEYDRAGVLWTKAGASGTADAIVTHLQRAMMEARSYQDGSLNTARSEIEVAERALKASAINRPDVPVWLASAKGMLALVSNDAKEAQRQFALAVDGSAKLPAFDPSARLTFRQRLAFTKIRLGDGPGAEQDFRALIHDYGMIEGPDGPDVLMTRMNLIQALMIGGKHEAVVAESDRLYPGLAKRLGQDHEMTLQLLTTRAQSEGVLERWTDAIRDDLRVHTAAQRKQGARSFFAVASLVDAATAQCRSGQNAAGLKSAKQAYADAFAGFGKVALTDAANFTIAECEIGLGLYASAATRLETIDADAVAQLAGDPNWGANVHLAQARIAVAAKHKSEARQHLEAVRKVYTAAGAEPYLARLWHDLMATTS